MVCTRCLFRKPHECWGANTNFVSSFASHKINKHKMSETTVENCDNSIHPHKDPPTEPSKQTKGKSKKAQTFDKKLIETNLQLITVDIVGQVPYHNCGHITRFPTSNISWLRDQIKKSRKKSTSPPTYEGWNTSCHTLKFPNFRMWI
jgi:hypothetical protein